MPTKANQVIDPLPPIVIEAINSYGKYYADQHNLGMSVRDDMKYIASVAIRSQDDTALLAECRRQREQIQALRDDLAILETASRRFLCGHDTSRDYVLNQCAKARAALKATE